MATEPDSKRCIPIKPETIQTIRRALRTALVKAGFPTEEQKLINDVLEGELPDEKEPLVGAIFASTALKQLEEKLQLWSEPTPAELQVILAQMEEIPRQLKGPLTALAKKMPHPRGGAPRKFKTEAEGEEACALVGNYLGKGYKLPEALAKVAKVKHVSLRTMQRTWQANQKKNQSQ